jgi:hypothetical protein
MSSCVQSAIRCGFLVGIMMASCLAARGQAYRVRPLAPKANPQIILGGTLSVNATPALVNFSLAPGGSAQGSSGVTVTTSWNVLGIITTLNLYGYFSSSSTALTDGRTPPHFIPPSAVFGQVSTGLPTSYTAFTQTTPFSGAAGLQLYTDDQFIALGGSRTDVLNLKINLASVPSLPSGTYTGTLTLQATMM